MYYYYSYVGNKKMIFSGSLSADYRVAVHCFYMMLNTFRMDKLIIYKFTPLAKRVFNMFVFLYNDGKEGIHVPLLSFNQTSSYQRKFVDMCDNIVHTYLVEKFCMTKQSSTLSILIYSIVEKLCFFYFKIVVVKILMFSQ